MKTHIKYLILLTIALYLSNNAWSQRFNVNVNIGTPVSYSYYYYPDYEMYYRIETGTWFIRRNAVWVSYSSLPVEYYFVRYPGCERVMLPYHGPKGPFVYHDKFRNAYPHHFKSKPHKNYVDYKMKTTVSNKQHGGNGSKGKHKH